MFKWRKYLLLAPFVIIGITLLAPSAIERLTQGFFPDESITSQSIDFKEDDINVHAVTSGRNFVWPLVWESIQEAPLLGHGRNSTQNEGITLRIIEERGKGEVFPHPHNAYLEWTQDNGYLGAIPVFLFFLILLRYSWILFQDNSEKIYVVTGGLGLSLLLAFLISSVGSQTFYPREGAVGMWVCIGLLIRVYIERNKEISGTKSTLINE